MEKYFLTKHAIDRLIERAPESLKIWPYLQKWDRSKDSNAFKAAFNEILDRSSENRSLINNTGHMALHFWDKYGYDSEFKFFENEDFKIQFVFVKSRQDTHFRLVTTAPFNGMQKTNKWSKTQTKEEKKKEQFLQDCDRNKDFIEMCNTTIVNKVQKESVPVEAHIKQNLYKLAKEGKTILVEKTSNALAVHKTTLDSVEYEFRHYKFKDAKALEVIGVKEHKKLKP